jgi:hypothetical protein
VVTVGADDSNSSFGHPTPAMSREAYPYVLSLEMLMREYKIYAFRDGRMKLEDKHTGDRIDATYVLDNGLAVNATIFGIESRFWPTLRYSPTHSSVMRTIFTDDDYAAMRPSLTDIAVAMGIVSPGRTYPVIDTVTKEARQKMICTQHMNRFIEILAIDAFELKTV